MNRQRDSRYKSNLEFLLGVGHREHWGTRLDYQRLTWSRHTPKRLFTECRIELGWVKRFHLFFGFVFIFSWDLAFSLIMKVDYKSQYQYLWPCHQWKSQTLSYHISVATDSSQCCLLTNYFEIKAVMRPTSRAYCFTHKRLTCSLSFENFIL